MTTWNTIHILNASPDQLNNREFIAACTDAYNAIKPKRAEAIEAALSVEGVLDLVLLDLLIGRESSRREVLRELVLAAEFCSSHQKWKMLKQFMTSQPGYFAELTEPLLKKLREELHSLINDRNKFAHGDLFVDARDDSVLLRYYEAGTKYAKITEAFLNDLIGRAFRSRETLFKLHARFGTDLTTMQVSVS
jgi:hypothetical protein